MNPKDIRISYDQDGDVLYIVTRPNTAAISREGAPGVMWRYAIDGGSLVGVTVIDFEFYWKPRLAELARDVAQHLHIGKSTAKNMLEGVA